MTARRYHVLGGGPAGLYFAILAKKANPETEITVFERNAADDTFGWGVVFSDETLGNLEEADASTYRAIRERFAYWDAIDMHLDVGGRRHAPVRTGGHGFCGIGRMRLLLLLQERARELGVVLRFGEEVDDIEALRDCDLLVAADGINSKTRDRYQATFQPTIEHGKSPFIWLGTHQTFEAFTFIFRENDHGVFNVHAYQFDPETSTFIVETDEETWKRAALDQATEAQSLAYCQELFAPELGGHDLLANRSSWIRFRTIACEQWHHENVVLLGDAVHTAHFSVGSGTKMAMEDSIELAAALAAEPDRARALARYQTIRKDSVGRTQKAAAQSKAWFEQSARHVRHPPERVNFSMLSRSRRITWENMKLRDRPYIEGLERWYAAEQGVDTARSTPPMFTPFRLRGLELPNRVVVSPMCQYSATDGLPNDWHLVHLGSRAMGGAGLVYTEMTDVSAEGRITPGCTGLYDDAQQAAWTRIVDFVHGQTPAKIAIQLGHAGRTAPRSSTWCTTARGRRGPWRTARRAARCTPPSPPIKASPRLCWARACP